MSSCARSRTLKPLSQAKITTEEKRKRAPETAYNPQTPVEYGDTGTSIHPHNVRSRMQASATRVGCETVRFVLRLFGYSAILDLV